jgi:hypothetical protein
MMAIKAYRDYARTKGVTEPEMVVPITIHAAFDKGAHYFGVKLIAVDVNRTTGKADLAQMARAINSNTIMIAGSAPNFPHGRLWCDASGSLTLKQVTSHLLQIHPVMTWHGAFDVCMNARPQESLIRSPRWLPWPRLGALACTWTAVWAGSWYPLWTRPAFPFRMHVTFALPVSRPSRVGCGAWGSWLWLALRR